MQTQNVAGQKKSPQSLESESDEMPTRRKTRGSKRAAQVDSEEEEFEISAGDLVSDLDYEENVPQ